MTEARAQRLIDEFNEGAASTGGHSVRHGIAQVLRHIADTESDPESWNAVPFWRLEQLADALTAPSLLERAMLGDRQAARRFLHEAGFTDERGEWLPRFRPGEGEP